MNSRLPPRRALEIIVALVAGAFVAEAILSLEHGVPLYFLGALAMLVSLRASYRGGFVYVFAFVWPLPLALLVLSSLRRGEP